MNIDLDRLIGKIVEGNTILRENGTCPTVFDGEKIINSPEYIEGDIIKSIIEKCFDNTQGFDYNGIFCRVNKYKTANPAKAAHGKIFEDTFNQVLAISYNAESSNHEDIDGFKDNYFLKGKLRNFEIPFLKNFFIPQLEWQHDALDLTVDHYNKISAKLKKEPTAQDRKDYFLHEKMNYTFETAPDDNIKKIKNEMKEIMGYGLNIKYSRGKYIRAVGPNKDLVGNKMFPDKAEMADFRNFWDDTHTGNKFNSDSPNILPFVGVWGVWEDISIIEDIKHYKCGKGAWFIKFEDTEKFRYKLWGNKEGKLKEKLESLSKAMENIKELASEIKENEDKYVEALAIYYGSKTPSKGTASKIISSNYNKYWKFVNEIDQDEKSIIALVEIINKMIKDNGGALKLNQKAFSYNSEKSNPYRPARIQVGFIPKKIPDFLLNGMKDDNKYVAYIDEYGNNSNKNAENLLTSLLMPIEFTKIEIAQKKIKKVKKKIKEKISVKIVKELFKVTKKIWKHGVKLGTIKKSNLYEKIRLWNTMINDTTNKNITIPLAINRADIKIPDDPEKVPSNISELLKNILKMIRTLGRNYQKGGGEINNDIKELEDIIFKLENIDIMLEDSEVNDGLTLLDIDNELNKYKYILDKEEQNINSEENLHDIKEILQENREMLYNQHMEDIPVFIDIEVLENIDDLKQIDKEYIGKLKEYNNSLLILLRVINESNELSNTEKIKLLIAYNDFKNASKNYLKKGGMKGRKQPPLLTNLSSESKSTTLPNARKKVPKPLPRSPLTTGNLNQFTQNQSDMSPLNLQQQALRENLERSGVSPEGANQAMFFSGEDSRQMAQDLKTLKKKGKNIIRQTSFAGPDRRGRSDSLSSRFSEARSLSPVKRSREGRISAQGINLKRVLGDGSDNFSVPTSNRSSNRIRKKQLTDEERFKIINALDNNDFEGVFNMITDDTSTMSISSDKKSSQRDSSTGNESDEGNQSMSSFNSEEEKLKYFMQNEDSDVKYKETRDITEAYNTLFETYENDKQGMSKLIIQTMDNLDIANPSTINSEIKKNMWKIFDNAFEKLNINHSIWNRLKPSTRETIKNRSSSVEELGDKFKELEFQTGGGEKGELKGTTLDNFLKEINDEMGYDDDKILKFYDLFKLEELKDINRTLEETVGEVRGRLEKKIIDLFMNPNKNMKSEVYKYINIQKGGSKYYFNDYI